MRWNLVDLSQKLPGHGAGFCFEVVIKWPRAQHFKKCVVVTISSHIVQVIVLPTNTNKTKTIEILKLPFLTVGCSFIRTRNVAKKNGLKLIHPRIDKGQWRVTVRYNGTRGNVRVGIFLHEKIKKLLTNFFGWRYRRAETSALQYLPLFPNVPQLTAHHHPSFLVESQHWIHKKKLTCEFSRRKYPFESYSAWSAVCPCTIAHCLDCVLFSSFPLFVRSTRVVVRSKKKHLTGLSFLSLRVCVFSGDTLGNPKGTRSTSESVATSTDLYESTSVNVREEDCGG